jgi:glucose-1-phosphate thymidylyltransferase
MKGIVLAGGSGTRLHPMTLCVSKQILPVYDKPMIYYPLSTLLLGGIRDILVISSPRDLPMMRDLLGDGSQWGIRLAYAEQPRPEGLAQAMIIAERFVGNDSAALVLGDNIFFGHGFSSLLTRALQRNEGATIFAYQVHDPQRYGVVSFDTAGRALSIEEKPKTPTSNWAVVGLYIYDNRAPQIARSLSPSIRGELEITDLNATYLRDGRLSVVPLGRGFAWFDTGIPESLLDASSYVATMEKRQGLKISCPEEIALRQGFISLEEFRRLLESKYAKSEYGNYLRSIYAERQQAILHANAAATLREPSLQYSQGGHGEPLT